MSALDRGARGAVLDLSDVQHRQSHLPSAALDTDDLWAISSMVSESPAEAKTRFRARPARAALRACALAAFDGSTGKCAALPIVGNRAAPGARARWEAEEADR